MADSLLQRITSGQSSFGVLARENSADSISGAQGGDLGYFNSGYMVPEFDKAAFESEIGDIKTVETHYGTHLLKVTDQKNTSRAVKIAVIAKHLEHRKATTRAIYANPHAFAASLTGQLARPT